MEKLSNHEAAILTYNALKKRKALRKKLKEQAATDAIIRANARCRKLNHSLRYYR